MNKQSDRIKRWRERQKAEGKTSFTVLLSQEGRAILTEEKEKTGESYAVIIEKALQTMKKHGYRTTAVKYFPRREDNLVRVPARDHQSAALPAISSEREKQPKILIDDFANYPMQTENEPNSIYPLQSKKGIITRLLQSSTGSFPFVRRKKLSR